MQFQDFEISDFSGGLTDNFIGREKTYSQKVKNFIVTVDRKLSVRPGSLVDGTTDTQAKISAGVEYLLKPFDVTEKPFKLTTSSNLGKLFYYDGSTHQELLGPTSNHLFTATHGAAADHRFSAGSWNSHSYITSASFTQKVQKIFETVTGTPKLRTAGLPKYAGSDVAVTGGGSGTKNYLMLLVWKHTYVVGPRTFVTRSALYRPGSGFSALTGLANAPTSITVPANGKLSNGSSDNYYTGASAGGESLVLEYYRTINNGSEFYLVGTQDNSTIDGAATITDGVSDTALLTNTVIYTSGGVAENDPPPTSKFIHITERGTAYYGDVNDSGDEVKNRVRQSKVGIPDACPLRFFDDIDDDLQGISSYRGLPIFLSTNNVYRGDGVFDNFGLGGLISQKIADYAGSVSHNGIVQTYFGVFFPGDTGFYWTNGYDVVKISDELNSTYATTYPTVASKRAISGCYDEVNQLIYWTFPETATSDGAFVLHLRFGIKANSVFTTIGGQTVSSVPDAVVTPSTMPNTVTQNFRCKSVLFFNQKVYRADERGYVMYFSAATKSDPRVVTGANISAWGTTYLFYDYKTAALDYGNLLVRKWTPAIISTFKNIGNISVQVKQDRDLRGNFTNLREMKQKSSYSWADPGILWGDPVMYASEQSVFEAKRLLRVPGIRCSYRTMEVTNAFTVIQKSDNQGLATVNASAKTATLINAGEVWAPDYLDYYITFEYDSYTTHFLVTAQSTNVLTFSDSGGISPPNGSYKWEVKGYAKGEGVFIQALVMPIAYLTDSQVSFRVGDTGTNA